MKYETYIPCDELKPFVKSFAIQESTDERACRVLPDSGLVIGFQYKGRLSLIDKQAETTLSISGFDDQAHFIKEFKAFTGETPESFFTGNE